MKPLTSSGKLIIGAILLSFVASPLFAAELNTAVVKNISGDVQYKKEGSAEWKKLDASIVLSEGDSVKTAAASEVTMELVGSKKTAQIVVRKSSKFYFKTFQHKDVVDTTMLDVSMGAVLVKAEKLAGASKFEVKTPTSIVGIRGTTFEVTVS